MGTFAELSIPDDITMTSAQVAQEFYRLGAMARAAHALVMQCQEADKDQSLVAAWQTLDVTAERADRLGDVVDGMF